MLALGVECLPSDRVNVCPAETSAKEEDHLPKFASRMKAGFPRDPRPASRVPRLSVADREPTCGEESPQRSDELLRELISARGAISPPTTRFFPLDFAQCRLVTAKRARRVSEREGASFARRRSPPHSSSSPNSMGIRSIRFSPFRFDGSSIPSAVSREIKEISEGGFAWRETRGRTLPLKTRKCPAADCQVPLVSRRKFRRRVRFCARAAAFARTRERTWRGAGEISPALSRLERR